MKALALIAVARILSFSGNQFADTFAHAFNKKGYPMAIIVWPTTTHQKLKFIMAFIQSPRVVIKIPMQTPNLSPFLSKAITAG